MQRLAFFLILLISFTGIKAEEFDVEGFIGYKLGSSYDEVLSSLIENDINYVVLNDSEGDEEIVLQNIKFHGKKNTTMLLMFSNNGLLNIATFYLKKEDLPEMVLHPENKLKGKGEKYEYYCESGKFVADKSSKGWTLSFINMPVNYEQSLDYISYTGVGLGQSRKEVISYLKSKGIKYKIDGDNILAVEGWFNGITEVWSSFTFKAGKLYHIAFVLPVSEKDRINPKLFTKFNECLINHTYEEETESVFSNVIVKHEEFVDNEGESKIKFYFYGPWHQAPVKSQSDSTVK